MDFISNRGSTEFLVVKLCNQVQCTGFFFYYQNRVVFLGSTAFLPGFLPSFSYRLFLASFLHLESNLRVLINKNCLNTKVKLKLIQVR